MPKKMTVRFVGKKMAVINGDKLNYFKNDSKEYDSLKTLFQEAVRYEADKSVNIVDINKAIEDAKDFKKGSEAKKVIHDIIFKKSDNTVFVADPSPMLDSFEFENTY